MAHLVISTGPLAGHEFPLKRGSNLVGRAVENEVVIDAPTVSSRHCEIMVSDTAIRVRDLGADHGTWIDGQRIRETEITLGQTLTLGGVETRLEEDAVQVIVPPLPAPPPPPPETRPDGTCACFNHPDLAATYKCSQCGHTYCRFCIRELHLVRGPRHYFCSGCNGVCRPIKAAAGSKSNALVTRFKDSVLAAVRSVGAKFKNPDP